ncbi:hypothetical protein Syun_029473 [Stephania yunnanensis]|uniref:Uncharacterized protein n=1 Tax=Stephania yunnanensis TaxID=152371 RepID=A0AAP0E5M9_9MAGN
MDSELKEEDNEVRGQENEKERDPTQRDPTDEEGLHRNETKRGCARSPGFGATPSSIGASTRGGGRLKELDEMVLALTQQVKYNMIVYGLTRNVLLIKNEKDHFAPAIVKVAGGELVKADSATHVNLVIATGWPALPAFISDLFNILAISVYL